jgi:L-serine dehydratase
MAISVFDIFKIGVGPSSSHTVGPMRAARQFLLRLCEAGLLDRTTRVRSELFGSLGLTGKGHGTDRAVLMGLEGETPEGVDPESIGPRVEALLAGAPLRLLGEREIPFNAKTDLVFWRNKRLPLHSNGMVFSAWTGHGDEDTSGLSPDFTRTYYSVGGGFVVDASDPDNVRLKQDDTPVPYPFKSGTELLAHGKATGFPLWRIVLENEKAFRSEAEVRAGILRIWKAFQDCVAAGLRNDGILPGGLRVKRRAPELHRRLKHSTNFAADPTAILDWVSLYALAVNEENAAGGRVVTAPTNGAAGIVPAVLHYSVNFKNGDEEGVLRFLLTAAGICVLYMENASISGAEVGCQGEVGVACSMAAAGLCAALGGTNEQVENAAEIGMEHNLGLTCDPVGGLVQIPCIERNAMGAVKAVNAARMALHGDGSHKVSLDRVIATMRQTGADMQTKYKETARGGLAVNVIEC